MLIGIQNGIVAYGTYIFFELGQREHPLWDHQHQRCHHHHHRHRRCYRRLCCRHWYWSCLIIVLVWNIIEVKKRIRTKDFIPSCG